jgi:hypothetical protein
MILTQLRLLFYPSLPEADSIMIQEAAVKPSAASLIALSMIDKRHHQLSISVPTSKL